MIQHLMVHPKDELELVLCLAVKVMNDKMGPAGLVASEKYSDTTSNEHPVGIYVRRLTTDVRRKMVNISRNEMKAHLDIIRINRALKHNLSGATDSTNENGDKILTWT